MGSLAAALHPLGAADLPSSSWGRACAPLLKRRPRCCRRLGFHAAAAPVAASFFDLGAFSLNFNHTDWLKVPRHQAQLTLYPWMEAQMREQRMRAWLQKELCMTEGQARSVLSRCRGLAELDVRLATRRLKRLDKQLGLSRGDAALAVLRRPHLLLPPPAEVVEYALKKRATFRE